MVTEEVRLGRGIDGGTIRGEGGIGGGGRRGGVIIRKQLQGEYV